VAPTELVPSKLHEKPVQLYVNCAIAPLGGGGGGGGGGTAPITTVFDAVESGPAGNVFSVTM
jgi:hypothetical protein